MDKENPNSNTCSSFSSSSAGHSLRERRLHSNNNDIHTELSTLHPHRLRDMEIEAEEYVLALITESNPLRYLGSLFKAWWKDGSSHLAHGFLTSKHQTSVKSPSLETSEDKASRQFQLSWAAVGSIIFLKSLLLFAKPIEIFGNAFEYCFNMMYLNHGLKRTLRTSLFNRDALKKPCYEDEDYYCLTGLVDTREGLHLQDGILNDVSKLDSDIGVKNMADVCVMASKFAYENKKVIKKVVEQTWKMNFVQFFDCWNDYLECNSTQAFIFTDKKINANIVVVAFRGTQPFNMYDWCTDFDFSYYVLPEIGRVHVGFLEALGLGTRLNKETLKQAKVNTMMKASGQTPASTPSSGLSEMVINDNDKVLAYDAICAKVRILLRQNLGAKLYITGHSLGGALATVFSALLLAEGSDACPNLGGIFTFGQPRVGDAKFANFMEKRLCRSNARKYFRVVYRTDVVPRVPFDNQMFQFKHISPCHYYLSHSESKAVHEEPFKGLFLLMLQPMPHFDALKDLFGSLRSRFRRRGEGYIETGLCVAMRFSALLCPGICAHVPTHYIDAVRLAPSSFLLEAVNLQNKYWVSLRSFTWPKWRWSKKSTTQEHLQ